MRNALAVGLAALAAGCTAVPATHVVNPLPAVPVVASGETLPVGTAAADAADDPAIWRNPADPAQSLIVATDKKAGLYVFGLDGKVRHFDPAGRLNNVDLIDLGETGIIVAASDRNDPAHAVLRLYRLDPVSGRLTGLGGVSGGMGEAYGICLLSRADGVHAFSVLKSGRIEEVLVTTGGAAPQGRIIRSIDLPTQTEGCVADPRDGSLYVGEEDVGIWRFAAGEVKGSLIAPADGKQLVADTEGLALLPDGGDGGWLIASSQGDNAYAVYRLPDFASLGRFRIVAGQFGATSETDGIAVAGGSFGPQYPDGLFIAQDGDNAPAAQNFKLVSWAAIKAALAAGAAK